MYILVGSVLVATLLCNFGLVRATKPSCTCDCLMHFRMCSFNVLMQGATLPEHGFRIDVESLLLGSVNLVAHAETERNRDKLLCDSSGDDEIIKKAATFCKNQLVCHAALLLSKEGGASVNKGCLQWKNRKKNGAFH